MDFSNSSGLTYTPGSGIQFNPILDSSFTGAGSEADPLMLSYSFEFTESQANNMNLPDLTSFKSLTCYMTRGIVAGNAITPSTDLSTNTNATEITKVIATPQIDPPASNTPNESTSSAIDMEGKKAIFTLLTWLGLMALY